MYTNLFLKSILKNFLVVYLQPTSPFRNHKHIDEAFNELKKKYKITCQRNKKFKYYIQKCKIKKKFIKPVFNENLITLNRQNFLPTYYPNGSIYIFHSNKFLKEKEIPIKNSLAYEMPLDISLDIDI